MKSLLIALSLFVIISVVFHLIVSPYTKVEESFNIQAIHDILEYGISPDSLIHYDHKSFPGVVPRTFLGSLIVSGIATPILKLVHLDNIQTQFLVRLIIGLGNAFSLINLGFALNSIDFQSKRKKANSVLGSSFLFLILTQFHLLYYSSRTLPNFMALPFVNYAFAMLLKGDVSGLTWLAFVGTVFRIEVGVLSVVIAFVSSIGFGQSDIRINLLMLVAGTLTGAVCSVLVDSYFWGQLVIPELASLQFNVIEGKAAYWGIEPFEAYFTKYLPQLFRPPVILILAVVGISTDPAREFTVAKTTPEKEYTEKRPSKNSLRILLVSSIIYIIIMSFQAHKEWRFIIYTVPLITLISANGLATLIDRSSGSLVRKTMILIFVSVASVAGIVSIFMGYISSHNYPGGEALAYIRAQYANTTEPLVIHMDVGTCMTGASRFGELHNEFITYDKTEDPIELTEIWNSIDILVTTTQITRYPNEDPKNWQQITTIPKFSGISILPITSLIQKHNSPQKLAQYAWNLVLQAYTTKSLTAIRELIDSPIVKEDFVFIYKRLESTIHLKVIEKPILDSDVIGDPDLDKIESEINEEIDNLEH